MKYIPLGNKRNLNQFYYISTKSSKDYFKDYTEEAYQYTKLHAIDDILK